MMSGGNDDEASEESSLLGGSNGKPKGAPDGNIDAREDGAPEPSDTTTVKEPSTKALLAVVGPIFVGVFFAALGTVQGPFNGGRNG